MDFKRGLSFMTQDPQWIAKVVIGTLVSLVPILNFAAIGYTMDVVRNVYGGREVPLPEWDRFGDKFVRGLIAVVIQFLWALPLFVLLCPFYAVLFATLPASPEAQDPNVATVLGIACLGLLMGIISLLLTPFIMVAQVRYAVTNSFGEALPVPVWQELRRNIRPWLLIMLFFFVVGIVMALIVGVVIVCTFGLGGVLVIPFAFYMQLVAAYLYAQAHREAAGASTLPPSMV